jgi:hypothetical protein
MLTFALVEYTMPCLRGINARARYQTRKETIMKHQNLEIYNLEKAQQQDIQVCHYGP